MFAKVSVSQVGEQHYDNLSSRSSKDQDFIPCKASQEITEMAVLTVKANRERTKELQMYVHTHPSIYPCPPLASNFHLKEVSYIGEKTDSKLFCCCKTKLSLFQGGAKMGVTCMKISESTVKSIAHESTGKRLDFF